MIEPFRDLLIRRKLTLIMTLTSCVTLSIASVAWLSHDWTSSRRTLENEITTLAELLGAGSAAAMALDRYDEVQDELLLLQNRAGIRRVAVFDRDGSIVAQTVSSAALGRVRLPFRREGMEELASSLIVYSPIVRGGQEIGTICIEADMAETSLRQLRFIGVITLVLLVSIVTAFLLSYRLQELISGPIMRLAKTVHAISERRDWSLRAQEGGKDEVGSLTRAFNGMLATIQERDLMLERARSSLEEKVEARTKELLALNEQLRVSMEEARAAAVAKSRFLANTSHEIRTPLNGILGMTDLLLDTPLSDQQRGFAEIAKTSADSLLEIINDILDFSKIEAGKLLLEDIELSPGRMLEDVMGLLATPARKKRLELTCLLAEDVPAHLRGDPTRLRQVITNLVGNAIKFTERGRVDLRCSLVERDERLTTLRFEIEDTGIGIEPEHAAALFRPFSQADASMTRKYGGTGLGLAISRQLVELMGGEIGVESEPGLGSTFWFTVVLRETGKDAGRALAERRTAPHARVLIVESSAAVREVLHRQLEAWSLEHEVAQDADRALAVLRAADDGRAFGVLLIDDALPGAGREALLDDVRARVARQELVPVVMSWQQTSTESALAGLEARFRLAKPVRPSQLFDALLAAASDAAPEPETVGASTGTGGDGPYRRTRILLAEDNRINELVACKVLARGGYRCDTVDDGASAVAAVKGGDYDVVLMDCQMPNVDGFAATRAIRAWEAEKGRSRVHIIALTANAMKGDRDRCLAAGMDDYVSKPLKPALLLEKIDALARRSEGPAAAADAACLARLRTELAAGAQERAHAVARELGALCEALESDELRRTLGELVALIGDERLDDARTAVDALERELARLRGARPRA